MSEPSKPVTSELKLAVKSMGDVEVGSDWVTAWSIVTVGPAGWSHATSLSVEVDALLPRSSESWAASAGIEASTSPLVVMPLTETVYILGPPLTLATRGPPAVEPAKLMSEPSKPVTSELKLALKSMGDVEVGSDWVTAWSIVTVGPAG